MKGWLNIGLTVMLLAVRGGDPGVGGRPVAVACTRRACKRLHSQPDEIIIRREF